MLQTDAVVGKREKSRLKELQKMKRQKIQEILDTQNAAIDADMVCTVFKGIPVCKCMVCMGLIMCTSCILLFMYRFCLCFLIFIFFDRTIKGRDD